MRQIVLDTETTGLNARMGDRVIEIACVELVNRRTTGNHFHRYVNPQRAVEEGALKVHGIGDEFLADKPLFAEVASEFLEYVDGAELIIHNAAFDVEFLDMELQKCGRSTLDGCVAGVVDTLRQARELHPGRRNSLDALCERYAIDNTHRTLHGALLDAQLLAEVYLAMTRGQESLAIGLDVARESTAVDVVRTKVRPPLNVLRATEAEAAEHARILQDIAKGAARGIAIWDARGTSDAGAD